MSHIKKSKSGKAKRNPLVVLLDLVMLPSLWFLFWVPIPQNDRHGSDIFIAIIPALFTWAVIRLSLSLAFFSIRLDPLMSHRSDTTSSYNE